MTKINLEDIGALCALLLLTTSAMAEPNSAWHVTDNKSPVDDSPGIQAHIFSEDDSSVLALRCKERQTLVFVVPKNFIQCGSDGVRVIYRFADKPAVESRWHASITCISAIAPSSIDFIRSMQDDARLFVRVHDRRGREYNATFNLSAVSKVRSRIADACKWNPASVKAN